MKGWIRRTWLGCAVALTLGAPLAHAGGGTITFSGAVVAPTCSASSGSITTAAAMPRPAVVSRQHFGCGVPSDAAAGASPTSYSLTVEPLESSALSADRLVSYFSGYVKAAGQADAQMRLVTQAYE